MTISLDGWRHLYGKYNKKINQVIKCDCNLCKEKLWQIKVGAPTSWNLLLSYCFKQSWQSVLKQVYKMHA